MPPRTGGWSRPRSGVGFALLVLLAACGAPAPEVEAVAGYQLPRLANGNGGRRVENSGPRERLSITPGVSNSARLLFLENQAAVAWDDGRVAWADPEGGRVIVFDRAGRVASVLQGGPPGAAPLSRPLAAFSSGRTTTRVVEPDGTMLTFEGDEPVKWTASRVPGAALAADGKRVASARTTREFALAPVLPGDPLVWLTDDSGRPPRALGQAIAPASSFLGQLNNAGWAAFGDDGSVYFASALRAEIRRFGPDGEELWLSTWEPAVAPVAPHLSAAGGSLSPVFSVLQQGITVGPDGRLYVLVSDDASPGSSSLLVFEQDGTWLRAATVRRGDAVFATRRGALYTSSPAEALARVERGERVPFPAFDLPELTGPDSVRSEDLRGRLVVVNFWASWCGPCRRELPLLDALARDADPSDLVVVGLNEDVDAEQARTFLANLGVSLRSGEGRGKLKELYHYRGLPYTVVLDRELRIVREIYGFGSDLESIESALAEARITTP